MLTKNEEKVLNFIRQGGKDSIDVCNYVNSDIDSTNPAVYGMLLLRNLEEKGKIKRVRISIFQSAYVEI